MSGNLLRLALDVTWRNLALGHEVFTAEGATFVRSLAFPRIYDANFVFGITASTPLEIASLLAKTRREYAHAAKITFRLDPLTPPSFEARLALDGFERHDSLILLLQGAVSGEPTSIQIQPIEDDSGWLAYRSLKRADWVENAARMSEDPSDLSIPDGLSGSGHLKCPPVRYFLALADDQPVGFCNAWEGTNGVGQVEDLFVLPAYRHRGIATALIHRSVAHARSLGAGPIVIAAAPTDTPKLMYAAMGWRPLAMCRQYSQDFRRGITA
jgi:GNAT superfamily N-acetyltransferase